MKHNIIVHFRALLSAGDCRSFVIQNYLTTLSTIDVPINVLQCVSVHSTK